MIFYFFFRNATVLFTLHKYSSFSAQLLTSLHKMPHDPVDAPLETEHARGSAADPRRQSKGARDENSSENGCFVPRNLFFFGAKRSPFSGKKVSRAFPTRATPPRASSPHARFIPSHRAGFLCRNMTDHQSPRTPPHQSGKRTRRSRSTGGPASASAKKPPFPPPGAAAVSVAVDSFARMAERHLLALNDVAEAQSALDAVVQVRHDEWKGCFPVPRSSPHVPCCLLFFSSFPFRLLFCGQTFSFVPNVRRCLNCLFF